MKRFLIVLSAAALTLVSCKPDVGEIGDHYPAGAGLIGTWELTGADQTDVTLPVPETRDISAFYTNATSKWRVTFNADSTYTVDAMGPGFNLFGNGGTWSYDTPEFPKELHLAQDSTTIVLPLGNMPRTIDTQLGIVYSRVRCDKPSIRYDFTFTRKN